MAAIVRHRPEGVAADLGASQPYCRRLAGGLDGRFWGALFREVEVEALLRPELRELEVEAFEVGALAEALEVEERDGGSLLEADEVDRRELEPEAPALGDEARPVGRREAPARDPELDLLSTCGRPPVAFRGSAFRTVGLSLRFSLGLSLALTSDRRASGC